MIPGPPNPGPRVRDAHRAICDDFAASEALLGSASRLYLSIRGFYLGVCRRFYWVEVLNDSKSFAIAGFVGP